MTVYADELFAVNFVSNILLLTAYAKLRGVGGKRLRIAAASAIGAAYAVPETVWGLPAALRMPVLILMVFTAFGANGLPTNTLGVMFVSACTQGLVTAAVSVMGAGAAMAAGRVTLFASEPLTAVVYLCAYPLMMFFYGIIGKKRRKRRIVLQYGGKTVSFEALYDSGDLLRYRDMPVIVIDCETAHCLMDFENYAALSERSPELLRYKTVGGGGAMPVFVPERCIVDGAEVNAAAAVAEQSFGRGCGGITCI